MSTQYEEFKSGNVTLRLINGNVIKNASADTVFLDPAGSAFYGSYGKQTWGGGGVSGVLYDYAIKHDSTLDVTRMDTILTPEEYNKIKQRKGACYKKYDNCAIIHVVSMNFGGEIMTDNEIRAELTKSYSHVFEEYNSKIKGINDFRMVTLSGAIFSGMYKDKILKMTPSVICNVL